MVVTAPTFLQLIHEDQERPWELHHGVLREKPPMAVRHNRVTHWLYLALSRQLDLELYEVRLNTGRAARPTETYYIPDLMILPLDLVERMDRYDPTQLEIYTEPLPLVVEVWSPSTGDYDVDSKLPEYQARGDEEIWRVHPYERTLTSFVRQPDGAYTTTMYRPDDTIQLAAIPTISIVIADILPPT